MSPTWSQVQVGIDQLVNQAQTVSNSEASNQALIKWCLENTHGIETPGLVKYQFNFSTGYSFHVLRSSGEKKEVAGIGRSFSPETAVAKAFGEMLERRIMSDFFKSTEEPACDQISINKGTWQVVGREKLQLPGRPLRSSNGWAVHFDPAVAVKNAIEEALERHLLLASFALFGWSGFQLSAAQVEYESAQMFSAASNVLAGGYRAGIVVAKLRRHPGCTFGYVCDTLDQFDQSERWYQAFFEAFEPLTIFDSKPRSELESVCEFGVDVMDRIQAQYALEPDLIWKLGACAHERVTLGSQMTNVALFDVQKKWGLPFPFYAALACGGDLLPLFFKETMGQDDIKLVEGLVRKLKPDADIPDVHPIL